MKSMSMIVLTPTSRATRSLRVPVVVPTPVSCSGADLASSTLVGPASTLVNDAKPSATFIERAPSCCSKITRR